MPSIATAGYSILVRVLFVQIARVLAGIFLVIQIILLLGFIYIVSLLVEHNSVPAQQV